MVHGLDALAHGAAAALVAILPACWLFWRLTPRLAAGHRALRPFIACCAAYGAIAAAGGIWAAGFERSGYADEAMAGTLLAGAAFAVIAFLILLLFPRKA